MISWVKPKEGDLWAGAHHKVEWISISMDHFVPIVDCSVNQTFAGIWICWERIFGVKPQTL